MPTMAREILQRVEKRAGRISARAIAVAIVDVDIVVVDSHFKAANARRFS